jgi:hypothetical protein
MTVAMSLLLICCRTNPHQVVAIRNLSSQPIYFLVSKNTIPTEYEIANIRPITSDLNKYLDENFENSLCRYRIKKNESAIVISSESAGIFVDAISLQEILKNRYDNEAHVFVIKSTHLASNTDKEIIDNKLYDQFSTLTDKSISRDSSILEYK